MKQICNYVLIFFQQQFPNQNQRTKFPVISNNKRTVWNIKKNLYLPVRQICNFQPTEHFFKLIKPYGHLTSTGSKRVTLMQTTEYTQKLETHHAIFVSNEISIKQPRLKTHVGANDTTQTKPLWYMIEVSNFACLLTQINRVNKQNGWQKIDRSFETLQILANSK